MYPNGIFPDPPPEVPEEKRYYTPFNFSNVMMHDFSHIHDKKFHPDSHRHIIKKQNGDIFWDITYRFDKYHRRPTPENEKKKNASEFLALFGDSNVMGYGLPEEKTLSNSLSKMLPGVKVYNYSGSGVYPYQILNWTHKVDRKVEIPEKEGVALYFYMAYHITRNMGSIQELGQPYSGHHRVVDMDDSGRFIVGGTFKEERPFWFWITPYLSKLFIFKYMNWDLKPRDHDFKVQTALIKTMRDNLKAQGIKKFYVVIHPIQQTLTATQTLLSYLHKENIPFIYFSHWRMEFLTEGPVTHVFDGHFSENANKVLSDGIYRTIKHEFTTAKK
jgi:hypothetical protein